MAPAGTATAIGTARFNGSGACARTIVIKAAAHRKREIGFRRRRMRYSANLVLRWKQSTAL